MKLGSRLQWKLSLLFLFLLLIGIWMGDLGRQARDQTGRWVIFSLSALGLWGAFHLGVSRTLTRPLREIIEVVKKFGEGLFNWRVRLDDRKDEIAELGRHLNGLAENLGRGSKNFPRRWPRPSPSWKEWKRGC